MDSYNALKIDANAHIIPPKYAKFLEEFVPRDYATKIKPYPSLYDMDFRFRVMDKFGPLVQVLTLGWPPIEDVADPQMAPELARMANDEMAELVLKYPDRFVAAIAILPMNDMEAALAEADRAIVDLRFRGVYVHTPINDKPLDSPEFFPLYEKMAEYDLPIFIHPMRAMSYPDYRTESESKYVISNTFGWPYETTAAMARLVFSKVLEKYPNVKFLTHHLGGMVPYYAERIRQFYDIGEMVVGAADTHGLTKAPIEYFRRFYADTAIYGNTPALMCGWSFFGADRVLFGIDFPLGDSQNGIRNYRQTISAIDAMDISDKDRKKIFEENARSLMRLPI